MTEFFADIGSNWIIEKKSDYSYVHILGRALGLIEQAANCGCTGVKFQYFKSEHLWDKNKFPEEYKNAKKCELPFEWIHTLSEVAQKRGLLFGLSVFDIDSVQLVDDYVDYFKIASFEASWFDLVNACYMTGKRLMMSLGQIDQYEMLRVIANLPNQENPIDLLHCVSKYPSLAVDCNLNILKDNPIINGYSDHTTEPAVLYTAISLGADVIEVHLDDGLGIEKAHSWTPWQLGNVINMSKTIELSKGMGDWDNVSKLQNHKYKVNPKTGLRG